MVIPPAYTKLHFYVHFWHRKEHYLGMWKSGKFHGPGILINEVNDTFYLGTFQEGKRVESSSSAPLNHDDKWTALFKWCAELLEQMVTSPFLHQFGILKLLLLLLFTGYN